MAVSYNVFTVFDEKIKCIAILNPTHFLQHERSTSCRYIRPGITYGEVPVSRNRSHTVKRCRRQCNFTLMIHSIFDNGCFDCAFDVGLEDSGFTSCTTCCICRCLEGDGCLNVANRHRKNSHRKRVHRSVWPP